MAHTGPTQLKRILRSRTQDEVALLVGISQASLSRILYKKQDPSEATVQAFQEKLGIPPSAWPRPRRRGTSKATAEKADHKAAA